MKYGIVGEHLSHSFSPEIHKLLCNNNYCKFELTPNEFNDFILSKTFKGLNITVPYKQTVLKFLDYIDKAAKNIGAVNTVINKNGKLYGYNTDYFGFLETVNHSGVSFKNKKVVILGTGGTSNTVFEAAAQLGAEKIIKLSRNPKNDFEFSYSDLNIYNNYDILINTTPVGMFPNINESPIDLKIFKKLECVFDVIYNPLITELQLSAKALNIKYFGGFRMLVAQAVKSDALFFDKSNINYENLYKKLIFNKQNIVLIGMPGCGKSTIGKQLASILERPFYDTDILIENRANLTVSEIFAKYGEKGFRTLESTEIKNIAGFNGTVISTGGGAILNSKNINELSKNGTIVYLYKNLSDITPTASRPLTSNIEDLKKIFKSREELYNKYCNFKVNVTTVDETATSIVNLF